MVQDIFLQPEHKEIDVETQKLWQLEVRILEYIFKIKEEHWRQNPKLYMYL